MPLPSNSSIPASSFQRDTIQDMLGKPPGWMLYSGISIVFLVVAGGLLLSALIRYPDRIPATVLIQHENPPIEIAAMRSGILMSLLVHNESEVVAGQLLGRLESATNWDELLQLEKCLNSPQSLTVQMLPVLLELGELQSAYTALVQSLQAQQFFLQNNTIAAEVAFIKKEIAHTDQLNRSLHAQERLSREEYRLMQKDSVRNERLYTEQVISEFDLEEKQKILLQFRRQLENLRATRIRNEVQIEQLLKQLLGLQHEEQQNSHQLQLTVQKAIEQMSSQLDQWKQQYLIHSPIDGRVSLESQIVDKKRVEVGQPILTVVPQNGAGQLLAYGYVPAEQAGKIGIGTSIQIMLDAFPYKEFGLLRDTIDRIAPVPKVNEKADYVYELTIILPDILQTTYGRKIPPRPNLSGHAQIITEDKSVLARVFDQLLNLTKNR